MPSQRLNYTPENDLSLMAYHVDYPRGCEVDLNRTNLRELAKQGWVDHPAKIGLNPWGADERVIAGYKAKFERGETEAFDYAYADTIRQTQKENEGLQEREEARFRQQRIDDVKIIDEEAKTAEERGADERSDAEKLKRNPGGLSHNLASAVRQSEIAHQEEQGDQTPTPEQQEEYLLHRNTLVEHGAALGISLEEIEALMKANGLDIDTLNQKQYQESCEAVTEMAAIPPEKRKIKPALDPNKT